MQSDLQLIRRYALTRDADVFSELVQRYAGMVYAVARRSTGSSADAQDISQICFLELARKADSISGSVAVWLHAVAARRAIAAARNRHTPLRPERPAARPPEPPDHAHAQESFDEIIAQVDSAASGNRV